tara:strand:- start:133 stop:669 length:537 start_codon:yes stop_codon:yes gene_type:complete
MAFKLDGKPLAIDVAFTHKDIQYPANWLRLTTKAEKEAIGITEVADAPTYDSRFYWGDGTAKALDDVDAKDEKGNLLKNPDGSQIVILGVKSVLKAQEKEIAKGLLNKYDWQVVRKAEKGTALDSAVITYRDAIRTAYTTRKTEITNCANTAALVTLYSSKEDGTPNMTQYPEDPNSN